MSITIRTIHTVLYKNKEYQLHVQFNLPSFTDDSLVNPHPYSSSPSSTSTASSTVLSSLSSISPSIPS